MVLGIEVAYGMIFKKKMGLLASMELEFLMIDKSGHYVSQIDGPIFQKENAMGGNLDLGKLRKEGTDRIKQTKTIDCW